MIPFHSSRAFRKCPVVLAAAAALIVAGSVWGRVADPALAQQASAVAPAPSDFRRFVEGLWPRARDAGVSRATFDGVLATLTLDTSLAAIGSKQPEFERPLKAYLATAASPARATRAQAVAAPWAGVLAEVERRYGVPREVVVAIWGMETDFGRDHGDRDVLRSLAGLAFYQPDRTKLQDEVIAALVILEQGHLRRDRLKGSWAGAMGNPQFVPSAYLKYAVSFDGSGPPDIWTSVPDSMASIANFLRQSGWTAGQPWGTETTVPKSFAFPVIRQDVAAWSRAGFTGVDGAPLRGSGSAMLWLPIGPAGPAFLLQPNFFVLKEYNFSDAYALAGAILSDRISGRPALRSPWPDEAEPLSRSDRRKIQEALTRLGFYSGDLDGRIGPLTRDAVHAYQRQAGVTPADGYPSAAILRKLTMPGEQNR
jgi:membrane-bound lytic murein transglycosylase B